MKDFDPDILPGASVLSQVNIERLFGIQRHNQNNTEFFSVLSIPVLVYPPSSLVVDVLSDQAPSRRKGRPPKPDRPSASNRIAKMFPCTFCPKSYGTKQSLQVISQI